MPGARPYGFHSGDSAEKLAEFVMSKLAFIIRVPRQEDIGHDLLCTHSDKSGQLLKAGPFFTVQIKSKKENLIFEKDYEIDWIKNQENPLFLCIVNSEILSIELYSTWNMLNAFLLKAAKRIVLVPGDENDSFKYPHTDSEGNEQIIPLGKPVLKISANEKMNSETINNYSSILKNWIKIDRENIINKNAGMYWVVGPLEYETNQHFKENIMCTFFWNPMNLNKCLINFGRCATALRAVISKAIPANLQQEYPYKEMIFNLENALKSHHGFLEPLAKQVLLNEVGLQIP